MKAVRRGFIKSIPILCSYLFVGMAYGITMQNAGFFWYDAAIVSILVYTGAFQFVLISLLSSGASLITIAVTALFVTIFIDQWEKTNNHKPAITGLLMAVLWHLVINGNITHL